MKRAFAVLMLLSATTLPALADCEADIAKIDAILKTQKLDDATKAKFVAARKQSVEAVKVEKDDVCAKVLADTLKAAGIKG